MVKEPRAGYIINKVCILVVQKQRCWSNFHKSREKKKTSLILVSKLMD